MNKKAILILVLACTLIITLTACNKISGIVYENEQHGFSLILPEAWKNMYVIEENDHGIAVYHKNTKLELVGAGRIFDIHVFNLEDWESEGKELADAIGLRVIEENEQKIFALGYPTDVQTIPGKDDLREEYRDMESDVSEIIKSFAVN